LSFLVSFGTLGSTKLSEGENMKSRLVVAAVAHSRAMVGITLMPGLDDYPTKTENTTVAHARTGP